MADGVEERGEHLLMSDEAEAEGGGAPGGYLFGEFVERNENVRPAVAGTEDIPGTEDGGVEAAIEEQELAVPANVDIGAHDRRGLGNADIDEETGAGGLGGLEGGLEGPLVDGTELGGFGGAWVCDTGEMDIDTAGGDRGEEGSGVEGVTGDGCAAGGEFLDRLGAG
jgi:hypothetical protein